jgi:catechol 2,3-dioxygenase-like lactoylglutathione lyase family enzyme
MHGAVLQTQTPMETFMNLNHVAVPTRDVPASAAFYARLGFNTIVETPRYARFRSVGGDTTFSLIESLEPNPGGVTLYFEVRELTNTVLRLQALGIVFSEEPKVQPWKWNEARLKDPSGNNICLFWAGEHRLQSPT